MIDLDRRYLETQIGEILDQKRCLDWLVQWGAQGERVADFGCGIGYKTLALVWALGANEAVGVDKNEESIGQARDTLDGIRREVERIGSYYQHYPSDIAESDKAWWCGSVPDFFKSNLPQGTDISYRVEDITETTGLLSNHYDVAYCHFVLHHIWYDMARPNARGATGFAVREMARVTKPGGAIAISELIQYSDKPRLDSALLFEEAKLGLVMAEEQEIENAEGRCTISRYLCRKPLHIAC